jgi:hypothetical protein
MTATDKARHGGRAALEAGLAEIARHLDQGDQAQAQTGITDLLDRMPDRPAPRRAILKLCLKAEAMEPLHACLTAPGAARGKGGRAEALALLRARLATGRFDAALADAGATLAEDDGPATRLMLGAAAIGAAHEMPCALPEADMGLHVPLFRLMQDLRGNRRTDLVAALVDRLTGETGPLRTALTRDAVKKSLVIWMTGDIPGTVAMLETGLALARSADDRANVLWRLVDMLLETGRQDAAAARFAELDALEIEGKFASLRDAQRRFFAPDVAESVFAGRVQHYRHGTGACLIYFRNGLPTRASIHVDLLLPILKRRGISLLTASDERRLGGATGCAGIADDIPGTTAALRDLLSRLGYDHVAVMGTSLAGYTALVQGIGLAALGCLSCAGFAEAPLVADMPTPGTRARARRLWDHAPAAFPTGRDLLRDRPGFVLHYHYGDASPIEIGEHPRFEGLPGASVFAHPSGDHDILRALAERGEAEVQIERFLDACGLPG